MHCTNTGAAVALSGTFSLAWNTTRFDHPGPSQNAKRRWANTQGDTWESTYFASVEDSAKACSKDGTLAVAEDSTGSDLSELDTEEGVAADSVTKEEEEEEGEEDECSED
jgi:hypothetical protein